MVRLRLRAWANSPMWQSEVVPQLVADTDGRLQVLTLFRALCGRHPGRFHPGQLRTLQRRVREWRVQYGPEREVYFEQVAVPGREAAFDFSHASDLGVTLGGVAFPHLLFEWVLCRRAMEVLDAARALGDEPLVLPTPRGRRLDVKPLRRLLERCGIACVPHGFARRSGIGRPRRPTTRG